MSEQLPDTTVEYMLGGVHVIERFRFINSPETSTPEVVEAKPLIGPVDLCLHCKSFGVPRGHNLCLKCGKEQHATDRDRRVSPPALD